MHKRPELDTVNPPGQIVNPITQTKTMESYAIQQAGKIVDADLNLLREAIKLETLERSKTIGGIIDRVRRDDPLETVASKETIEQIKQRAYTAGFIDGKKEGFSEGIAWVKGK